MGEGAEVIDEVVDIIRREAESCDCPQAFQIFHSIGGGTGGGVGTLALFSPGQGFKVKLTGQEITDQIWWSRYHLADVQWENGKYLSACCIYRGGIASQEIDDELAKVQMKMSDNFVSWIPNNIQSSLINVPTEGTPMSVSMAANTTAIKNVFIRILNDFRKLYKRGAFLHSYTGEGMDRMEFDEADKNAQDLITEYQDKQDVDCEIVYYDYDDTEDDEDEDDF